MPRHTVRNHKYYAYPTADTSNQPSLFSRIECEFCNELTDPALSRFRKIYGDTVRSRIILNQNGFIVMPTLGQLFKGSLLILPGEHYETMAELPAPNLESLMALLTQLQEELRPLGFPVIFEHGAKCSTGSGCGIYHAHLHLVPVSGAITVKDALPAIAQPAENLFEALQQLRDTDHYIVFQDTDAKTAFLNLANFSLEEFPSQYFRQVLVYHFNLQQPWDWRLYTHQEPWLLETLTWFGGQTMAVQKVGNPVS